MEHWPCNIRKRGRVIPCNRRVIPCNIRKGGSAFPCNPSLPSQATKDTAFLAETLHTHTLFGGAGVTRSVLDCLIECYEHLVGADIGVGQHGLLRMLTSDWRDARMQNTGEVREQNTLLEQ